MTEVALKGTIPNLALGRRIYICGKPYDVVKDLREDGDDPHFRCFLCVQAQSAGDQPIPSCLGKCGDSKELLERKSLVVTYPVSTDGEPVLTTGEREKPNPLLERMRGIPVVPRDLKACVSLEGGKVLKQAEVREFIDGPTLSALMKLLAEQSGRSSFSGIRDSKVWFKLTDRLIRALRNLHDERIVHGDLRPRNIVFRKLDSKLEDEEILTLDGLGKMIDKETGKEKDKVDIFFLDAHWEAPKSYSPLVEKGGTKLLKGTFRRKYDSPLLRYKMESDGEQLQRVDKNARWFASTDIFSLAIILFELACGSNATLGPFAEEERVEQDRQTRHGVEVKSGPEWFWIRSYEAVKSNRQMKDTLLREYMDILSKEELKLNRLPPEQEEARRKEIAQTILRESEVILACLRSHTDRTVSDLQTIDTIRREFDRDVGIEFKRTAVDSNAVKFDPKAAELGLDEVVKHFNDFLQKCAVGLPELVIILARSRGARFIYQLERLIGKGNRPYFLQIRERPAIVDALVTLINLLEPGETSTALLTPAFFRKENMGFFGRLTCALQLAAIRGVKIEWIILVDEDQLSNHQVEEVLQRQNAAAKWLCAFAKNDNVDSDYGVYYAVAKAAEYTEVLRDQLTSIFITLLPWSAELPETDATKKDEEKVNSVDKKILIAPDYHGEGGIVAAIRLWPELNTYDNENIEDRQKRRIEPQRIRRDDLFQKFTYYRDKKIKVSSYSL